MLGDADDTSLQLQQPGELFLRGAGMPASSACSTREARESIGTLAQLLAGQLGSSPELGPGSGCVPAAAVPEALNSCIGDPLVAGRSMGTAVTSVSADAMLVATDPATIFEASIAARPNFEARQQPRASWWYQVVNALILAALLAGAVVELITRKHL